MKSKQDHANGFLFSDLLGSSLRDGDAAKNGVRLDLPTLGLLVG